VLPEEIELARLETQQAALTEQAAAAELLLETTKTESAHFQHRYYEVVGRLYAQLDEINAQVAEGRMKQARDDPVLKASAQAAKEQAKKSAEEAGLIAKQPKPPPVIEPGLKQAFRQAVKLMHPDLAITEAERKRRTELMTLVNLAYERGDLKEIERLIEEFGQEPEAIVGEDIGSRIVKAIRRIAQLRRRLSEIEQEMEALQKTEIFRLRDTVEKAESKGDDPLGDLALQLKHEIAERQSELKAMRQPGKMNWANRPPHEKDDGERDPPPHDPRAQTARARTQRRRGKP
jgi:hypothetical protein